MTSASNDIQTSVVPEQSIFFDARERVEELRCESLEQGLTFKPPILALGISERVGSNWFLDTVANTIQTHNEPFRQQLHGQHPFSTLSPRPASIDEFPVEAMHPYERYWLINFVASKYGQNQQLIKETNLFFSTSNFVELFPDAKVIVLARNPIGIASSFADNELFKKWGYAERYNQVKAMTRQPQYSEYGFVFEGAHDPGSMRKLARMVFLNTVQILESLEDREYLVVRYEDCVRDREAVLDSVSGHIFDADTTLIDVEAGNSHADHVFNTHKKKTNLVANLEDNEIRIVKKEIRRLLAASLGFLSLERYEQLGSILEPHSDEYKVAGRMPSTTKQEPKQATSIPDFAFVAHPAFHDTEWGNQLVTNEDFTGFVNRMYDEGVSNVINGTQLLFNENMIPQRGGRIWFNSDSGDYEVSSGFEHHPVYWITWLGAAAYARYQGARLPTLEEARSLMSSQIPVDITQVNCDHRHEDVTVAGTYPPDSTGMYDTIGNLSIWCSDGIADSVAHPVQQYMLGPAWNKKTSDEKIISLRTRPITGSSRSVGARLVRHEIQRLRIGELGQRFERWFDILAKPVPNHIKEQFIIDQLTK